MTDKLAGDTSEALTTALRKLTEGFGVRNVALHAELGQELRALFHVPDWDTDALRTLARVSWQLERLITTRLVGANLQQVARISYNLGEPAIRELKLGQRREWLYEAQRKQSPSESQRDLRLAIVPTLAASLRTESPPEPADAEVAAVMAVETGHPATDYLPFPTGQPTEVRVLVPGRERAASNKLATVSAACALLLAVVLAVVLLQPDADNRGDSTPPAGGSAITTVPPTPTGTVTEVGGNRHGSPTFRDPFHPAETGQKVPFRQEVHVSCKVRAFSIDSIGPDGYWYRIAAAPWNNQYYAPAITFLNGDPVDGPYEHNFDEQVSDC